MPAGTLDPDELITTCARRELLEETGLKTKKLTKLGAIYPVPGYSTEIIHIFKAEQLTLTQAQPEEYEVIETIPMTRAKVQATYSAGKAHGCQEHLRPGFLRVVIMNKQTSFLKHYGFIDPSGRYLRRMCPGFDL